ncbi:2-(3-amino-3-carboxypropyl)histidine synthase subunit [Candidatus Woesearchaeota archaeon]|nr:2-(3-amino-3-carboxypropyl)histidine synthase subunit [Candidatus Woesearchaeota archaeon]
MDVLHVEARYNKQIALPQELVHTLPNQIILFTTVQFLDSLPIIKKQLTDAGKEVSLEKPRHTPYEGQLLGCSTNITLTPDALYIGTGLFHPKALLLRNDIAVYTYDPITGKDAVYTKELVQTIRKKVKGAYAKFIMSKNIGVLITLKLGQQKAYMAAKLEEQYPDKTFYYFVDNTINLAGLLDFPFIDMYLNTMCERMGYDDMDVEGLSMLNLEDLWALRDGTLEDI